MLPQGEPTPAIASSRAGRQAGRRSHQAVVVEAVVRLQRRQLAVIRVLGAVVHAKGCGRPGRVEELGYRVQTGRLASLFACSPASPTTAQAHACVLPSHVYMTPVPWS